MFLSPCPPWTLARFWVAGDPEPLTLYLCRIQAGGPAQGWGAGRQCVQGHEPFNFLPGPNRCRVGCAHAAICDERLHPSGNRRRCGGKYFTVNYEAWPTEVDFLDVSGMVCRMFLRYSPERGFKCRALRSQVPRFPNADSQMVMHSQRLSHCRRSLCLVSTFSTIQQTACGISQRFILLYGVCTNLPHYELHLSSIQYLLQMPYEDILPYKDFALCISQHAIYMLPTLLEAVMAEPGRVPPPPFPPLHNPNCRTPGGGRF